MSFDGRVTTIAGLMEMELPDRTVRLCDGGFVDWPARGMFRAKDEIFGTLESVETVSEGVSDEFPAFTLTLLPPKLAAASDLFRADAQGSSVRFWLAEVDRLTGLLVGTPEQVQAAAIDTIDLRVGRAGRYVDVECTVGERAFMVREANVLSTSFHQRAWPGEKGFDHCDGTGSTVPWGVPDPTARFAGIPFLGRYLPGWTQ